MKFLRLVLVLVALCVPAVAGDIQDPPRCTQNCPASVTLVSETTVTPLRGALFVFRIIFGF